MDSAKYLELFVTESRDHLQRCARDFLAWERAPDDAGHVDALFRSVHTLKGMAASLGYAPLANLAHALEHVLSAARDGEIGASPDVVDVGLRAIDLLEQGVARVEAGQELGLEADPLIAELSQLARPATGTWPIPVAAPVLQAVRAAAEGVEVRVSLRPETPLAGARAALVLRQAESLGKVTGTTPPPEAWLGDTALASFSFRLATAATDAEIRRALQRAGEVDEITIRRGAAPQAEPARMVRVGLDRLDRLVTLGGELVVARTRLLQRLAGIRDAGLREEAHRLGRLVTEFHEQVLLVRMAPAAEMLERFPRTVRDLARKLGKQVRLEIEGEDIELDRALLEQLPDVLLHLLRNAVDHGIEAPEVRQAAGKPAEGRVRIAARREGDAVLVDVEDDGRGIDRAAVLMRAEALGLPAAPAGESTDELLQVLARPGFSTAARVTDVSGRGVGIDAVVQRVRALGGTTELSSRPGAGTTVRLRLPLSVAVVPAMLVDIAGVRYAVPLAFVAEAARLEPGDAVTVTHRGRRLARVDLGGRRPDAPWRPGVILDVGGRTGALVVDTLLGREDIVVGPMDAPRGTPPWVNGATILSDGVPALLVDPAALV